MPLAATCFNASNLSIVVAYAGAFVKSIIGCSSISHEFMPSYHTSHTNPIPSRVCSMNERRKIEERLRKKEEEIRTLEAQIRDAWIYVQALQDVLKILPRTSERERDIASSALRPGSGVGKVREFILSKGEPSHILELLQALGKEPTREA